MNKKSNKEIPSYIRIFKNIARYEQTCENCRLNLNELLYFHPLTLFKALDVNSKDYITKDDLFDFLKYLYLYYFVNLN